MHFNGVARIFEVRNPTIMNKHYRLALYCVIVVFLLKYFDQTSGSVRAQSLQRISHRGYEVSFGLHQFSFGNAERRFNNLKPESRGVALGFVYGNNLLKGRLRGLGFYHSSKMIEPISYYRLESELLVNFYPLEFLRTGRNVLDIYLFSGFSYSHMGYEYIARPDKKDTRFNQVFGAGFECLVPQKFSFFTFFTELSLGSSLYNTQLDSEIQELSKGAAGIVSSVNIGLRFGRRVPFKAKSLPY